MRKFIATGLALFAALYIIWALHGCTPMSTFEKKTAAGLRYEEQQSACVDQYADTAHIDACRDKVKRAWATDAGAKDGAL